MTRGHQLREILGKQIKKVYGVLMGPYETLYIVQKFPNTVRDFHGILTKFAPRPKNSKGNCLNTKLLAYINFHVLLILSGVALSVALPR